MFFCKCNVYVNNKNEFLNIVSKIKVDLMNFRKCIHPELRFCWSMIT